MIEIINKDRFISEETLNECVVYGEHTYVDKVLTGNGFSTKFLTTRPPKGKVNIMIAPNRAVVLDKEDSYSTGNLDSSISMSFFLKDSFNTRFDSDVLVFVLDSFVNYREKLDEIKDKINWILIDESHSVDIQSSFRKKLVDFDSKVERYLSKDVAIMSVTASPNKYSPVTHTVINNFIPITTIHQSNNFDSSIERLKKCVEKNEPTVVFSNSWIVPYMIRDDENVLEVEKLIVGTTLERSIRETTIIKETKDSRLLIVSSTGFEGIDINGFGYNVFFFENRSQNSNTFYMANLYQAINRTRYGAKYIEYMRSDLKKKRKGKPTEKRIEKLISSRKLHTIEKQGKDFKEFHEFMIFSENKNTGDMSVKKNTVSVNLWRETLEYDNDYDWEFLTRRNIKIDVIDNAYQGFRKPRPSDAYKKKILMSQDKDVSRLFGSDYRLTIFPYRKLDDDFNWFTDRDRYNKELRKYLRRKNYNGDYELSKSEKAAIKYFSDYDLMNDLIYEVRRKHDEMARENYSQSKARRRIKAFRNLAEETVFVVMSAFVNETGIHVPKNITGHRDYNIITRIRPDVIRIIGDVSGVDITSIDIKSAFPRVLYALNGMSLPDDFYGDRKKNKVKINTAINDFFYKKGVSTNMNQQRINSRNRLKKLKIDDRVIDFMIDNFFLSTFRGEMFHFLSFHEKKIMEITIDILEKNYKNSGCIRRHDEVIIFNNKSSLLGVKKEVKYLGFEGWF